jgi:hypothetical protein
MMVGGPDEAVVAIDPILDALAPGLGTIERTADRAADADPRPEKGYIHAGPAGAGHFVKMVHNGIEYGMMAAFAEGFDILKSKASDKLPEDERFDLNLPDIAEAWRRGSVVSSWLLDLTADALARDHALDGFAGNVADRAKAAGRWKPRWKKPCRPMCCPPRSMPAIAAAARPRLATRCCRPCASALAATWKRSDRAVSLAIGCSHHDPPTICTITQ